MKKILFAFLICTLLFAITVQANTPKVVDQADLLTNSQITDLEAQAQLLADTYQMDVVILTVPTLNGQSPQDFADDYFDNNGYGIGDEYSGVLLLLSMEYRDWAVSTCGNAISALTDADIDTVVYAALPYLSDGDYYTGFQIYLNGLETNFAEYQEDSVLTPSKILLRFLLALIIGAAVAGIVLLILRSQMNTAKLQSGASNYVQDNSFDLFRCHDLYLYSHTSKIRRDTNNGGSSTHRSSSGRSHGGRSGKF